MSEAELAGRPERVGRDNPRFKWVAVGAAVLLVAAAGLGVTRAAFAARQGSNAITVDFGNGLYTNLVTCLDAQGQVDYSHCSSKEIMGQSVAVGYVFAAEDMLVLYGAIDPPENATRGQAVDIVQMYLKDHPATRNLPSAVLIRRALRGAWPPKNVPKPNTP